MTHRSIFAHAARLHEQGNALVLAALKKAGLRGLAPSHGDVLACLFALGACNMGAMARRVGRSKSTMTALVEKMERHGYVERTPDPDDARGILVRLTEKGCRLRPLFDKVSAGLDQYIAQRLSPAEADLLNQLLIRCVGK